MKYLIITLYFLISLSANSQNSSNEYDRPTVVTQNMGYFYKNNWKPFTGSLLSKDSDLKLITKIKIVNGLEVLGEIYNENNELVRLIKNGIDVEMTKISMHKTEFLVNEKYSDTSNLEHKNVIISYKENPETREKIKFNGVVVFENIQHYYKDGTIVKVEVYFDQDLKQIKESYGIFYTELGNIEFPGEIKVFDGDYKKWDIKGNLIESSKYKFGKKVK